MSMSATIQAFANAMGIDCMCCPSSTTNPKCATTIKLDFFNFDGSKTYCYGPSLVVYTITGTTTTNKSINLTGQAALAAPNYRLSLMYNGDQLPAGNYTLSISEQAAVCGHGVSDVGRFSTAPVPFKVVCPTTAINLTTTASFDLMQTTVSYGLGGCTYIYDGNGGSIDVIRSSNALVAVQVGGAATLCSSTPTNTAAAGDASNIAGARIWVQITGYPFTIASQITGNHLLPADEARTYSACGSYASDWQVNPYCYCDQAPVSATSSCAGGPLAGVLFTISGGLTGSGTTTATTIPHYISLTGFVQDKTGTTADQLTVHYTATRDRFQDVATSISGANGPVRQGCGFVAQSMQPAQGFYCCGCQLPAPAILHGSALGKSFLLSWVGQSIYGTNQWVGTFTSDPIACVDCQLDVTNAPVFFAMLFSGMTTTGPIANQNPGLVLNYSCANQDPSGCNQAAGCGVGYDNASYGGVGFSSSESCVPFMGMVKGTWSYNLNGGPTTYHVPVTLTISE